MEQKDNNPVLKQRSTAACVKEGFALLADHPRSLLYATWPYLLLTAAFMAPYLLMVTKMSAAPAMGVLPVSTLVTMYVCYVLYNISGLFFTGRLFHVFRELRDTGNIIRLKPLSQFRTTSRMAGRSFLFNIWVILLSAPGINLFSHLWAWIPKPQSQTGFWALVIALFAVGIVAIISLLPLVHTYYKYILDGGHFLKVLGKSYTHGSRHKGKIFGTSMLSCVLLALILMLVLLPLIIISMAYVQSIIGAVQGDPSGIPAHFGWLTAGTFLVCSFLSLFFAIIFYNSLLYVYGSIEVQENERETYIAKTNTES